METFIEYKNNDNEFKTFNSFVNENINEDIVLTEELENKIDEAINLYVKQFEGKKLEEINFDEINEGFLGAIFGGLVGFALGKSVGKLIAKILGIEKGVFFDLLTSRLVGTAIGAAIGSGSSKKAK